MRRHISGREATYMAIESDKRGPVKLELPEGGASDAASATTGEMTHDPMRQADIARRLANLARARRCGAKTRAGHPCKQAAVSGRARCRMHGGAKGSGGPRGNRNGNFKHGIYTHEAKTTRRVMRENVREVKSLLQATEPRAVGETK